MNIFLNPGHDRELDSGAVGFNLRECDAVYQIGMEVERLLKNAGQTVKSLQCDDLNEICAQANNFDADIFISIHANACNTRARGTETFYYPYSFEGRKLALAVQNEIVKSLGTVNRGLKNANFYVLRHTLSPAILVETAFIDNYEDNQLLKTRPNDFAAAIARGILNYVHR